MSTSSSGLEAPGVLDAIAHDKRTDEIVLAMFESRPWLGDERQLFQLQEKLNAYVSFALDGELADAFPDSSGKRIKIQLRTTHEPDDRALEFLAQVREQLSFQDLAVEVVLIGEDACGEACSCGS